MLQDGEKDAQRLGSAPEGESAGQISLDDARNLALRHARDNRDFYGRLYAVRDLEWEVLSRKERRDYFDIRLSFRPAEAFTGRSGVERIVIDKWGLIRLRVVLQRPVERKTLVLPGIIAAAIIIILAAVGGLIAAGVFSNDSDEVPLPTASVSLTPETASRLISPQGDVTVDLEAGSVAEAVRLLYEPISAEKTPSLPPGYAAGSKAFDLSVAGAAEPPDGSFEFIKPITVTVSLSAGDLEIAGQDEINLVIQHYIEGDRSWEALPTTVDLGASIATAQVDRLSIFALTIKQPLPAPSPVPTQAATPARATVLAGSPTPEATRRPVPTVAATQTPRSTPTATPAPIPTSSPAGTPATAPTLVPAQTATLPPTPTHTPVPVPTPAPASTPAPSSTPIPNLTPAPIAT